MNQKNGFTIVELVIVIGVIGILAAITLAAYNGIQERARLSAAKVFATQLEKKNTYAAEGMWNFDECSGNTVTSKSDTLATTATTVGTLAWSNDSPTGTGCAAQFNGSTYIRTNAQYGAKYYLKAAWINITACGNNNVISSPDTGGNDAPFYLPSCNVYAGHNGSYGRISSLEKITPGKWHHIAVEFDNGTYTLYLDGKKVRESTGHPDLSPVDGGMNIGAHRTGSRFSGLMDNVLIVSKKIE